MVQQGCVKEGLVFCWVCRQQEETCSLIPCSSSPQTGPEARLGPTGGAPLLFVVVCS